MKAATAQCASGKGRPSAAAAIGQRGDRMVLMPAAVWPFTALCEWFENEREIVVFRPLED